MFFAVIDGILVAESILLLTVFVTLTNLVYSKLTEPAKYWQKKGVFYVTQWETLTKAFQSNNSAFDAIIDRYKEFPNRRYYGSYQFLRPSLFVRDLNLIKQITVKDFDHFPDHLNFISEKTDPIVGLNLFNLKGEKWKSMRSTLSPAFTSAKMRSMYTLIQDTAENFGEHFHFKKYEMLELEMKNLFARYTNDVIASCAFGIKCDSLKDQNNQFFTMGATVTSPVLKNSLRGIVAAFFPKIFEYFRIPIFSPHLVKFFRDVVVETISFRKKEKIARPDLINLLMQARKGQLKQENETSFDEGTGFATVQESSLGRSASKMELTDDVITAQALVFFLAGFETTATMLSFLFYELALNPNVQSKLKKEIDEVISKSRNKRIPYEKILKMKYLDQVISETLRKYPVGFILTRLCAKDYKIEAQGPGEKDFVLNKNCLITIPVAGIHRDPKYFPEPDRFDPERFSNRNKANIVPGSYMPFGSGPRNCIGSRFAVLEAKVLIVTLLPRFDIEPVRKTPIPIKLAKALNLHVREGIWLGFKHRKT